MSRRAVVLGVLIVVVACGRGSSSPGERAAPDVVDVPGIGQTRVDVPRPSGAEPATCEPLAPSVADGQSVEARVIALRAAGLFRDTDEPAPELADRIEREHQSEFGEALPLDDPIAELLVARADASSVWWGDLEADVGPESGVYKSLIEEWAAISHGTFQPEDPEETWASNVGPVTIAMRLGDEPVEVRAEYLDDWIDPRILARINELVVASGRQFELYRAFDQTLYLVNVTPEGKGSLEARGWCFEWPSGA